MEKGWVKLYRKMLENSFLMHDDNAYMVFTKLLLLVGQDKGQWSGGRMQLADWVNMNPNTLKDVLKRLENNGMISTESMQRYTIISIQNWSIYQNKPNGGQKKSTPDKRPKQHQTAFEEITEVKQGRNKTPDLTPLTEQRSKQEVTPDLTPQRHHSDTTATPLYKEKEENEEIKRISTNVDTPAKKTYGNSTINEMFEHWEDTVGYPIQSSYKKNRNACSNLVKKYTVQGLEKLIGGVSLYQQDRFASPKIVDFIGMQENLNALMAWGRKNGAISNARAEF